MPESSKILRYGVGIVHFGAEHRAIIDIHNPQRLYYTRFFWRSSFLAAFALWVIHRIIHKPPLILV